MINRVEIKREAKQVVSNARVSAYLFTLLYLVVVNVLDLISTYVSGDIVLMLQNSFPQIPVPEFLLRVRDFPGIVVLFVTVMIGLLSAVLYGGYTLYHLGVRRGEEMGYTTLFDGFSFVGKLIVLDIVMYIFIFLWSMLFVIPGIIAAYRYRFAVYNLCENPDIGVMEAIRMSKVQTQGYKMDLFVLDLSFIGWQFLCALTLGILSIWVSPYMFQADMGYFQRIKRVKGVGWFPPQTEEDGQFHSTDPFDSEF